MPSNRSTADRIDRSELPEFLRSKAIGAVIAEALLSPSNGDDWPDAYRDMVQDAASEIRTFHGLPRPDDVPVEDLAYRFQRGNGFHRDEAAASEGAEVPQ